MQLPLSWLKEFLPLALSNEELAKTLTLLGLEVDGIHPTPLPFEKVVVARVEAVEPHPSADKLQIATVNDGSTHYRVVCGDPKCRAGVRYPFAPIGARLDLNEEKPFKIKRSKIRGVESEGMLCSLKELGLGEENDGIAELPDDWTLGESLAERFGDQIIEISLTPNLGHCMSLLGVARELAAATKQNYRSPEVSLQESTNPSQEAISVRVETPELCPRYGCRVIRGVKTGSSPDWLRRRLEGCGLRSVNNIVDVTNYVMMELGQPMHAFDLAKIEGSELIVRRSQDGERLVTLDGKERKIAKGTLVIADGNGPLAIAGVMGGASSEVGDESSNLLLEAAYFEPRQVAKASRHLALSTESSKRFERGCDPNQVLIALDRAAQLIQEVAGGEILCEPIDCKQGGFSKRVIALRTERTQRLLGITLSQNEIESLLQRLECETTPEKEGLLQVAVPTYRSDLQEEIDLIEEVGRLYGYHNIDPVAPRCTPSSRPHTPLFSLTRSIQHHLLGQGLQQIIACNLIAPAQVEWLDESAMPRERIIEVVNPGSQDHSLLRPSLLPGLLDAVRYNCDRQVRDLALFEIGQVHFRTEEGYDEERQLGIALSGQNHPFKWLHQDRPVDFFDLKGMVETLLSALGVCNVIFRRSQLENLHPGRQAQVECGPLRLGTLGEIHPATLRAAGITQPVLYVELNLHDLLTCRTPLAKAQTPPLYPSSERDWTLTLPEEVSYSELLDAVNSAPSRLLESVALLDIYRSDTLGIGNKNITLRFVYRAPNKTLSVERIEQEHARITAHACKALEREEVS